MQKAQMEKCIVNEGMLLSKAMAVIDENRNKVLFVINDRKQLCGAVTDGDIRRWLIKTGDLEAKVSQLMNHAPKYVKKGEEKKAIELHEKYGVTDIPVLNENGIIVDVIFVGKSDKKDEFVTGGLEDVSVIIMAGGKGTRLYPYTKVLPKPLIPIGDVPIVERIINYYHRFGISDFIMTVNYRKNMIKSYFAELDADYAVSFVEEDKPLGTGGSIKLIKRDFLNPIFVANCDTLIKADYKKLYEYHKEVKNAITIITAVKNDVIPYGVVYTKENGEIDRMIEKPQRSYMINTGMYVINPEVIELIPSDTFFHMPDLIEKVMAMGLRVGMYPISEDSFLDMGEFEEMKRMEEKLNLQ